MIDSLLAGTLSRACFAIWQGDYAEQDARGRPSRRLLPLDGRARARRRVRLSHAPYAPVALMPSARRNIALMGQFYTGRKIRRPLFFFIQYKTRHLRPVATSDGRPGKAYGARRNSSDQAGPGLNRSAYRRRQKEDSICQDRPLQCALWGRHSRRWTR